MKPALSWEVRAIRPDKPPMPLARFLYVADCVNYFQKQQKLDPDLKFEIAECVWEQPVETEFHVAEIQF